MQFSEIHELSSKPFYGIGQLKHLHTHMRRVVTLKCWPLTRKPGGSSRHHLQINFTGQQDLLRMNLWPRDREREKNDSSLQREENS